MIRALGNSLATAFAFSMAKRSTSSTAVSFSFAVSSMLGFAQIKGKFNFSRSVLQLSYNMWAFFNF
jgi:hypothetical protein